MQNDKLHEINKRHFENIVSKLYDIVKLYREILEEVDHLYQLNISDKFYDVTKKNYIKIIYDRILLFYVINILEKHDVVEKTDIINFCELVKNIDNIECTDNKNHNIALFIYVFLNSLELELDAINTNRTKNKILNNKTFGKKLIIYKLFYAIAIEKITSLNKLVEFLNEKESTIKLRIKTLNSRIYNTFKKFKIEDKNSMYDIFMEKNKSEMIQFYEKLTEKAPETYSTQYIKKLGELLNINENIDKTLIKSFLNIMDINNSCKL